MEKEKERPDVTSFGVLELHFRVQTARPPFKRLREGGVLEQYFPSEQYVLLFHAIKEHLSFT